MDEYSNFFGMSVKVVNNELRVQRVDTGSLQKVLSPRLRQVNTHDGGVRVNVAGCVLFASICF